MATDTQKKQELVEKYRTHGTDTGSPEVQVALLTERINGLTEHFKTHKKDHHSRRGLLQMGSQRKQLIEYLKHRGETRDKKLSAGLGLRK
jgi:small subunit ribosomal protein S15